MNREDTYIFEELADAMLVVMDLTVDLAWKERGE